MATRLRQFSPTRAAVVLMPLLVAILYHPAFHAPPIFDDGPAITQNATIRHLDRLGQVLSPPRENPMSGRPVTNLSLAIDYAIFGIDPWGMRLTNMVIHVLCGWLLMSLVARSLAWPGVPGRLRRHRRWIAAAAALLWTVHPLNSEAVIYLTQRTELMVSLWYLVTLYTAMRGMEAAAAVDHSAGEPASSGWMSHPSSGWFAIAIVACALGMGSKEVMVSAPLAVLLYDRAFASGSFLGALRRRWALYLGLAATWGILAFLVWDNPRGGSTGTGHGVSALDYLRTQAGVVAFYVRLVFWPHPLIIFHDWPIVKTWGPAVAPGLLVVALLAATGLALWRWPRAGFAGACFFLILGPTSSVVPIVTEVAAERRMYLPSFAMIVTVLLAVPWLLVQLQRRLGPAATWWRFGGAAASFAVFAALATACLLRAEDYRTPITIWRDASYKDPNSPLIHNNLGSSLIDAGAVSDGIVALHRAIALKPAYPDALTNLGAAYSRFEQFEKAAEVTLKALELKPDQGWGLGNMGLYTYRLGRIEEGMDYMRRALIAEPNNAQIHIAMGQMLGQRRAFAEAAAHLYRAVELQPENAVARGNLAVVLADLGQMDAAVAQLERGLQLDPTVVPVRIAAAKIAAMQTGALDQIKVLQALVKEKPNDPDVVMEYAAMLARAGRYDESERQYRHAVFLSPNSARASDGLGAAIAGQGRYEEARPFFERALELDPKRPDAMLNLGVALMALGEQEQAVELYRRAIAQDDRYAEAHYNLGNALAGAGERSEAIEHYRKAVALRPSYVQAHFNLGNALDESGQLDDAAKSFRRTIELDPRHVFAWNNLGRVYARQDQLADAVKCFERALSFQPDFIDATVNLDRARAMMRRQ